MKRSFLTVAVAAGVFVLGACNGREADTDIEPVEELQPAPAPAPAPMPMDSMTHDTLHVDTLGMPPTTTGM
jgi:hypothetical protein